MWSVTMATRDQHPHPPQAASHSQMSRKRKNLSGVVNPEGTSWSCHRVATWSSWSAGVTAGDGSRRSRRSGTGAEGCDGRGRELKVMMVGDQELKVVMVGDGSCGKTSLLTVFAKGDFPDVRLDCNYIKYIHTNIQYNKQQLKRLKWK